MDQAATVEHRRGSRPRELKLTAWNLEKGGKMRSFRITVNDRTYMADVEQIDSDRSDIIVDGMKFETEFVNRGQISTWIVRADQKTIRAQTEVQGDSVRAWLLGTPFFASIQPVPPGSRPKSSLLHEGKQASMKIRALMPGRVTSVIVKENDKVEAGSPLLILEAMKMQNEITAPIPGRVRSIYVRDGENVKKDSVLIEVG